MVCLSPSSRASPQGAFLSTLWFCWGFRLDESKADRLSLPTVVNNNRESGGLPACNQKERKFWKPLPLMTGWCHFTNSLSVERDKRRKLPIPRFVLGLVESVIQSDPSGSAFLCAYRNPSKQPSVPIYTFFLDVHLYKSKRRERIPPQLRHYEKSCSGRSFDESLFFVSIESG